MVRVELDDQVVERPKKRAERDGISLDELLENLMALYRETCD